MSASYAEQLARTAMAKDKSVEEKVNLIAQALAELASAVAKIETEIRNLRR